MMKQLTTTTFPLSAPSRRRGGWGTGAGNGGGTAVAAGAQRTGARSGFISENLVQRLVSRGHLNFHPSAFVLRELAHHHLFRVQLPSHVQPDQVFIGCTPRHQGHWERHGQRWLVHTSQHCEQDKMKSLSEDF